MNLYPFTYDLDKIVEKNKKTFVEILRRIAFTYNDWKRTGKVPPELMMDVPLFVVMALGSSIPKRFQDTDSLEAIGLTGMAIGNLPEGDGYNDYDEIMEGLLRFYHDPHYSAHTNTSIRMKTTVFTV